MSNNYFNSTGTIGFTCDVCGRELQSCTWINGMRFCAKCYQETFGASKDWQLLDKDKTIAEQRKQVADLEAKLAEQQECSLKASEKHSLETQNAQICIKELEAKLAEKDKEFEWLHQKFAKYVKNNQDKISFAVEQLEKVKEKLCELFENEHGCAVITDVFNNQIGELKRR